MIKEQKERLFSKDYLLIIFSSLGPALTNTFFITALVLYMPHIGALQIHNGLFMALFALSALIMRPIAGRLTEKFGRVKFLIIGAIICGVCAALFGIAGGMIPLLLIIRSIHGLGFGIHSTCAGAVAADVVPKSRLAEGIGYFSLHITFAQAVGPIIALAIIRGDAGTPRDFRTLFFTAAALCCMSLIVNSCITYERRRRKQAKMQTVETLKSSELPKTPSSELEPPSSEPLPKTFLGFEYAAFAPMSVIILLYFAMVGGMTFLAPLAMASGMQSPWPYFLVSAAGVFVSRLILGTIADRRGYDIVIIPWIAVMTVCMALLPFVRSIPALIAIAFPIGFAQGAVIPTFNAMLFKRCSPQRRGSASGAFFAAIDIGFVVAPLTLSALVDAFGDFRYVFWAASIFVAISLVLYLLIASDKKFYAKRGVDG